MNNSFEQAPIQNVGDIERVASVASGLMLVGKGLRRGGLIGILEFALGGMALARGFTGHCEAKRIVTDAMQDKQSKAALDQRYSHMPMDSEVRSPDFEKPAVKLPDAAPMGSEQQAGARATPSANS